MTNLLTYGNPKLLKGEGEGYLTVGLHLAPHNLSGRNVCPWASDGCSRSCLHFAGRAAHSTVIKTARLQRTEWFFQDRKAFMAQFYRDMDGARRRADKLKLRLACRPNLTSDIVWENVWPELFTDYDDVQFYDYTKSIKRMDPSKRPANYDLTFSRSETNDKEVGQLLGSSRVAVVFDQVPSQWRGIKVIDADQHDLRFTEPNNVIAGLKAKGPAKRDTSGFVIHGAV